MDMPVNSDGTEPSRAHAAKDFTWMEAKSLEEKQSLWTRVKEDPLVPLGCALTATVLFGGLVTFQRGQSKLGNKFMQARVIFQTATVVVLAVSASLASKDNHEREERKYEDRMKIELREH
ncbi:hypothetical protein CCR75_009629 [Bremia lactucae]|uniref:HIG1 domain-containing protein n=1 Tax=Bremia lactucae TaxID=4779 RepID=A0A976FG25_BRELC|nr:hypothetical protein CCR75_009629 [Bremia lactucae]